MRTPAPCCTLYPQPAGTGGPLRIVFAEGPGRYGPGGFPTGSGDVGDVRGDCLNLHEPGAVRALLDGAATRGWRPEEALGVEIDGWCLLEAAAAARAGNTANRPVRSNFTETRQPECPSPGRSWTGGPTRPTPGAAL
ncbi:hypothetical protein [Kitasatospora griseola]|uniref:hypothetical protein n=1 Tax=Kitasatospora griseola TaxID=2064 RepID=UPI00380AD7DC